MWFFKIYPMSSTLINPNPQLHEIKTFERKSKEDYSNEREEIDALEIFELLRSIKDPEHPFSLEQLNVLQLDKIHINDKENYITIYFTPTVAQCSMATLIGLCIRVKLLRFLPKRFKILIFLAPGSHSTEEQVNKQLNDKERVAAALENSKLLGVVNQCLK